MTAFTFQETPESRAQNYSTSSQNSISLQYKAVGEQDDAIVRNYANANVPATVNGLAGTLYLRELRLRPDGWQQYYVDVEYGPANQGTIPTGSYTFNFDTTGGTTNIKCAKSHIHSYYASGITPTPTNPHKGAIGVKDDGSVEGADIVIPKLKLTFAFKYASGIITPAKVKAIASITGCVNSSPFIGFAAGELLFLGASGSDGTNSQMEVTFNFEASQNVTGISVGGVTGIAKHGHEYGWEEFADGVDTGRGIVKASAVHIEQVYDTADFGSVFGWNIYTG